MMSASTYAEAAEEGQDKGNKVPTTKQARVIEQDNVENGIIESFGYEQSYRRVFQTLGGIALTIAMASPMGAILIIASYQVFYAGYWGMSWGWIIPSVLFAPQALAVAELASSMPVNGAFYWWVAALAPPKLSRPLSFITGIANTMVIFTGLASFAFACGNSLVTVINFMRPDYVATAAETMGISMAIIGIWMTLCFLRMERIQSIFFISAAIALITTVVFLIALPVTHATKGLPFASASAVFGEYTNYSDWDNAVAVPMSFFSVAWVVTGWASPAYVIEETHDAQRATPKAIVSSYVLSATIGIFVCLILAFCITDMEAMAFDPSGMPMYTLLLDHWGVGFVSAFFLVSSINTFFGGSGFLISSASQLAAFARDGGVPFGKQISRVHERTNIPVTAVAVLGGGGIIFLLLAMSAAARTIIYSLAVICSLVLYSIPISLRLCCPHRFSPGPWNYGKFSWAVHAFAFLSLIWLIIMESFPATRAWTVDTFNFSWVLTVGVFLLAGVWYAIKSDSYQPVSFPGDGVRR